MVKRKILPSFWSIAYALTTKRMGIDRATDNEWTFIFKTINLYLLVDIEQTLKGDYED
jgi:hypothetical protein